MNIIIHKKKTQRYKQDSHKIILFENMIYNNVPTKRFEWHYEKQSGEEVVKKYNELKSKLHK